MGDMYSLEKAVKSKKSDKSRVSQDVVEEAARIEEQNYERAQGIRIQLDDSSLRQRATGEELLRQGETLDSARDAAVGINYNARRGAELAEDIEREGRIFSCELPCVRSIKKWFRGNRGNIEDIVDQESQGRAVDEQAQSVLFDEDQEEYVPGQNKTDKEMVGVLNAVRHIRVEADRQNRETHRQKTVVKEISLINDRSEKVIKETDKELKKVE